MVFFTLWKEIVEATRPTVDTMALVFVVQMILGIILPMKTLLDSVHGRSRNEAALICIVPILCIVSFALVEALFFGSFLGSGFTNLQWLAAFLNQRQYFVDIFRLSSIFAGISVLFLWWENKRQPLKPLSVLFSVGIELLLTVWMMAVSLDYLFLDGRLFYGMPSGWLKLFVYAGYLLLSKGALYLFCLFWGLLFSSRRRPEAQSNWEWVKNYLLPGYQAAGIGSITFGLLCAFAVCYPVWKENPEEKWFLLIAGTSVALFLLGLAALLFYYIPGIHPNLRRIQQWNEDTEQECQKIRTELEQQEILCNDVGILTPQYLVHKIPVRRLFKRELLESIQLQPVLGVYILRFSDKSSCRINKNYAAMMQELLAQQAGCRKTACKTPRNMV